MPSNRLRRQTYSASRTETLPDTPPAPCYNSPVRTTITPLFQFPLSHLALLRRAPFWAQALAVCALFAIAGVAVVDDYGMGGDETIHRQTAISNAYYIATGDISELSRESDRAVRFVAFRYYGIAFETPLLLAERALGLQGWRPIYLTRHLLTHLFFIAGGFACGMLAYRMLGSRWIALLAMLMFLLHPRLYAHSFFNSKDIPFAVTLVVALYLAHRAFRRDTLGAFLLCGIGAGLAINLRPFGLMLLPMILAMRAPDLWQVGKAERKHILMTGAAFLAAAIATTYIIHPYYWGNPLRFVEGIRSLSQHPFITENLFMGEVYFSDALPWNYIPVWFAITAPPAALFLGALGAAAVCWQSIARPLAALRDREIRFRALLFGCVVLPVAVVIILQSTLYYGWRHMYFLWGPFCLLAAVGLHSVVSARIGGGLWKIAARLPGWIRGVRRLHITQRALAYGVAGVGLLTTLTAMAALHPHQQVYFNALTDTKTPGALAERYDMDYWLVAQRQSVEYLLARYPDDILRLARTHNALILPQNDLNRIALSPPHEADFYVSLPPNRWNVIGGPALHSVQAYGSDIAVIYAPSSDEYRSAYRAAYNDAETNGTLLARSDFDIYAHNGALHYLSANCAPPMENALELRFFLHIFPANPADLPADSREFGIENRDFQINNKRFAFFDGKCVIKRTLPDYPIARIATGQKTASGVAEWRADIDLATHIAARAVHDRIAAGDYGAPVAKTDFDVYMRGNSLAYLKEPCAPADADARFFLHITPADPSDLPADRRDRGFANLDFRFADRGVYAGGKCVAERELPGYAIARIRTGQKATADGGVEWRADINLAARAAAQALHARIAAGDYGPPVAQSHFDLYLRDNALTYLKAPCAPGDTHARFFLHIIPADPTNLPADRRARGFGFVNLDFQFGEYGARIGDKCVASPDLPDYPIDRIRTGQHVSGEGAIWGVEFAAER